MPQIAPIVINDGAATPAAITFSPTGRDAKTGVFWFEQTNPVPVNSQGAMRIGYKHDKDLSPGKVLNTTSKVSYTLHVPTLEVLGNNSLGIISPPTLAYKELGRVEFELAERATAQERKNTRVLMLNLLGSVMASANIDLGQPSYA